MVRATCFATALRDKLHEKLHRVTGPLAKVDQLPEHQVGTQDFFSPLYNSGVWPVVLFWKADILGKDGKIDARGFMRERKKETYRTLLI